MKAEALEGFDIGRGKPRCEELITVFFRKEGLIGYLLPQWCAGAHH